MFMHGLKRIIEETRNNGLEGNKDNRRGGRNKGGKSYKGIKKMKGKKIK